MPSLFKTVTWFVIWVRLPILKALLVQCCVAQITKCQRLILVRQARLRLVEINKLEPEENIS